jgi:hypothetical protein
MTILNAQIQTAAPGVGAVCGAALVSLDYPLEGLLFFAVSLVVYVYVQR